MKSLCSLLLFWVGMTTAFAQCGYDYTWAEHFYTKGKYTRAEAYCYKILDNCGEPVQKAGAWNCLMKLYQHELSNDSLYLWSKKSLVRLGFENGPSAVRYFVDVHGRVEEIDQGPRIDLYTLSRELCSELYSLKEYDSAYYYFVNYAEHTTYKSWCGTGSEFRILRDDIVKARLCSAANREEEACKALEFVLGDRGNLPWDNERDYPSFLATLCLYTIVQEHHLDYGKGALLDTLASRLRFTMRKDGYLSFGTNFRGADFQFSVQDLHPESTDTLALLKDGFQRSRFAEQLRFLDMLTHDSLVTLEGYLSQHAEKVELIAFNNFFQMEGVREVDLRQAHVSASLEIRASKIQRPIYELLINPLAQYEFVLKNAVWKPL